MSDREGHGHKAVVYKSHFPPLRQSVVTETPADTLANKPRLTKDQALCSLCPHNNNDDVLVISPTPKKRKMNQFVQINNSKSVPTCIKCVNQHVQGASGTNQSNICDLSQQPILNTVSADNTSHYQITGQPDPSLENPHPPDSVLFSGLYHQLTKVFHGCTDQHFTLSGVTLCRIPYFHAAVSYTLLRLRALQGSNQVCDQ